MHRLNVSRKQILLADDDDAARWSIREALDGRPFDFLEADCGLVAVEIARREPIDLLFLDMNMPDITGLDVLRRIRGFDISIPCVLVSGACTDALASQALDEGAYTMLDKPLSVEIVRSTVRVIMRMDCE